jgi:hypothetical protein
MKLLISISLFLIAVSLNSISVKTNETCNLEMSKKEILSKNLNTFNCEFLTNENIISFKVKVPEHKTVSVSGHLFNDEAKNNINEASTGDSVTLFDITADNNKKIPPIMIKLVE